MDKNTIIGFVLIAAIMFGFSWFQSKQYNEQMEIQSQLDSVARVEAAAQAEKLAAEAAAAPIAQQTVYKDSVLSMAAAAQEQTAVIENEKLRVEFTTRGAQFNSVKIKDYKAYDSDELELIKPTHSDLSITLNVGELINTKDFVFSIAEKTANSVAMRLNFSNGAYIEQKFVLEDDSYVLKNSLTFEGLPIPRNVSSYDYDFGMVVPRLEKGYKNESQYSKLNWYYRGEKKPDDIGRGRDNSKRVDAKVQWFAFQQQFFSAIVTAENDFSSGEFGIKFCGEDDENHNLMTCSAKMRGEFQNGKTIVNNYEYYFGPNHYQTLRAFDRKYEKVIPLGGSVIGLISRFIIIPCFNFIGKYISSFGLVILLMTILIKVLISPLTLKSYKSSAAMRVLKPEIEAINKKYPKESDAMKKQQATMDLYRKAGVSPMGGCLPMLLQFPVLWAMFRFFPASIELRQQKFLWADDLSAYDSILDFGFRIPLFGDHLSLFALLMALTMFLYSKMTSSQMSDDPNMAGMKFMSVYMMPIMMLFICNNLSSALSYYYLLSNLITILQTWVIKKFVVTEDKVRLQIAAASKKPVKKSKFQQKLEEMQKQQEAMMRQQQNRK